MIPQGLPSTSRQSDSDNGGTLLLECLTQHIRCWRCWKVFHTILEPYDFESNHLFRCERCQTLRALHDNDFLDGCFRYIRKLTETGVPNLSDNKTTSKQFTKELEERWSEACSCGGRFRANVKPNLLCPHCNTKTPRWIPWPIDPQVTPPLPVLKYVIPTDYLDYEPTLPPLHERPPRKKPPETNETVLCWVRPIGGTLLILFLFLTLPIVWFSKLLGLLTKGTNRRK